MLCRANSAAAQQSRASSQRQVIKAATARRSVAVQAGMLDNMLKKVVGKVRAGQLLLRNQQSSNDGFRKHNEAVHSPAP